MEIPICVIDARTFVDHIHDIKRWIYNGQLKVVIPLATFESVEQLELKIREPKALPKEPARPRSSGKPAKKEYPAFDINPLLARNFLSRLKAWKEKGADEESQALEEKENHGAVSFQQTGEQYTPWKDVEVEEEKPQAIDDRPSTWAEALRKKQSLSNGLNGNLETQKGPIKPKLVAKTARSDSSPWKIKRDAPKIPVKDVPVALRPLMSFALWRLHESIDRNDANELFLLSDQAETRKVAQKLNIIARSTKDLGIILAARLKKVDAESYGDLERDFGVEPKVVQRSRLGLKLLDERSKSPKDSNHSPMGHTETKQESDPKQEEAATSDGHLNGIKEEFASKSVSKDPNNHQVMENEMAVEKEAMDSSSKIEDVVSRESLGHSHLEDLSAQSSSHDSEEQKRDAPIHGAVSYADIMKDLKARGVPATKYKGAVNASHTVTPSSSASPLEEVPKSTELGAAQTQINGHSPASSTSAREHPQPVSSLQEPEDSDEEIVVFVPQPKRFSNQKKPAQQTSRPSTPISHPKAEIVDQKPKRSPIAGHAEAKPPIRGPNGQSTSHGHQQQTSAPTIIDPDAFGRSFAVNPHPGPQAMHNSRSHHRPKRSGENAQLNSGSHHKTHQHKPRSKPSSQSLRDRSPRISPAPEPKAEKENTQSRQLLSTSPQRRLQIREPRPPTSAPKTDDTSLPNNQGQNTSPQRRLQVLERKDVTPRGRGPNFANPGAQSEPKSLSARMIESEEFIPRSAFSQHNFGPIGTPPHNPEARPFTPKSTSPAMQVKLPEPQSQVQDRNSFPSRSLESVNQNRPHVTKRDVPAEADGFVPRSRTPVIQKRPTPQPDYIEPKGSMPDVHYVLKSGSTRAATRGRGRLWTPS
ncbi:hypothetical protein ACLMJK_006260 [Lecanora helva]